MSSVSAAKSMTNALSAAIVASDKLPRTKVWGETDSAVSWQGPGTFATSARRSSSPASLLETCRNGRLVLD